jgi:hypothetical protein
LLHSNQAEARDVFRELLDDPDPEMRRLAETASEILPLKRSFLTPVGQDKRNNAKKRE